MAHSNQANKRIRQTKTSTARNKDVVSAMRTYCKKVMTAVATGDKAQAEALLSIAIKRIDKAAKSNVIHSNAADRKKRQVMKAVHSMA